MYQNNFLDGGFGSMEYLVMLVVILILIIRIIEQHNK